MLGAGLIGYFAGPTPPLGARALLRRGRCCSSFPAPGAIFAGVACFLAVVLSQPRSGARRWPVRAACRRARATVAALRRACGGRDDRDFMDMRQWMALLEKEGELRRDRRRGGLGSRARRRRPPRAREEGPRAALREHHGLPARPLHEALHRRPRRPAAAGPGARLPRDVANAELRPVRHEEEPARRSRRVLVPTGPVKERHPPRRRRRPDRVPGPALALPGGRALHPHLLRHRHARSRHARDERGHLSRDDRPARHLPDAAHQGRPALGPPLP